MFGLDSDSLVRLLYLVALLAFVLGGIGYRRGLRRAGLQHLVSWAAILLALVAIYAYRAPLLRLAEPVLGELRPSRVATLRGAGGGEEYAVRRGPDGHFHLDAEVNGATVRFLVDTGASSTTLTVNDAERAGIDTSVLRFDHPVQTANGLALSASATVASLDIGPFHLADMRVEIMPETALDASLLGMSTIDRFGGWRVEGDRMVLVP